MVIENPKKVDEQIVDLQMGSMKLRCPKCSAEKTIRVPSTVTGPARLQRALDAGNAFCDHCDCAMIEVH